MAEDFKYEIKDSFGKISENGDWTKELNLISYGDAAPKFDIRSWRIDEDGIKKMSKGITLNKKEVVALRDLLNSLSLED